MNAPALRLPTPLIESQPLRVGCAAAVGVLMTAAIFTLMYELIGTGPIQREDTL